MKYKTKTRIFSADELAGMGETAREFVDRRRDPTNGIHGEVITERWGRKAVRLVINQPIK